MNTAEETGKLNRATILDGDDSIGREQMRLNIVRQITELHGQITHERYDSSVESLSSFLQRATSPSLFQEIRIFHIGHAQGLDESEVKELSGMLKYELPDAYFIVEIEDDKKGKSGESKVAKKLLSSKKGAPKPPIAYYEFVKPSDYKLAQWLVTKVPMLFGRQITKTDADYLVDLVGHDMDSLYSELQKIDIHLEPRAPIDHDTIELIVGAARLMTVFELASALGQQDFARALQITESLFSMSFYAPVLVSALFRHFWALFRIRLYSEAHPQNIKKYLNAKGFNNPVQNDMAFEIGRAAGLLGPKDQRRVYPVVIASGIVAQARKFTAAQLRLVFSWLLDIDVGSKTGRIDVTKQTVQLLCYKIARVGALMKEGVRA